MMRGPPCLGGSAGGWYFPAVLLEKTAPPTGGGFLGQPSRVRNLILPTRCVGPG